MIKQGTENVRKGMGIEFSHRNVNNRQVRSAYPVVRKVDTQCMVVTETDSGEAAGRSREMNLSILRCQ